MFSVKTRRYLGNIFSKWILREKLTDPDQAASARALSQTHGTAHEGGRHWIDFKFKNVNVSRFPWIGLIEIQIRANLSVSPILFYASWTVRQLEEALKFHLDATP